MNIQDAANNEPIAKEPDVKKPIKGLTVIFLRSGAASSRCTGGLRADGRRNVESTVEQLKERETGVDRVFSEATTAAIQSAEIVCSAFGRCRGGETLRAEAGGELTPSRIRRLLGRYYQPGEVESVVFVTGKQAIAEALSDLTGKKQRELKSGEALIVHFNTSAWREIGPEKVDREPEKISPVLTMALDKV